MELRGEAAIVTGGHSGMGFAAAVALVGRGARVAILGRRAERVRAKAEEIGALGLPCDVADPDAVDAALAAAESANGPARILIHAAADGYMRTLLEPDGRPAPTEAIRRIIETNVLGTIFANRAFAARLVRAAPLASGLRGVIVNVSSIGAADGVVGAIYPASKGCVDALGLSLARELGPWGIRVCTISPGAIDTEMFRGGAVEGTYAVVRSQVPAPARPGRPEEFAALALHLCENDYLNGINVRLDGGMRIPFSFDVGGGVERPNA